MLRESSQADNVKLLTEKSRLLTLEKTSKFAIDLSDKAGKVAAKVLLNHEKEAQELDPKSSTFQKVTSDKVVEWNLQEKPDITNKDIFNKCLDSVSGDQRDIVQLEVNVIGKLEKEVKAGLSTLRM